MVVIQNQQGIARYNLEIGVMTVLSDYPYLNDEFSKHSLETVVESIRQKLPEMQTQIPIAIYSGGELSYMKAAQYELQNNMYFKDINHPKVISLQSFRERNRDIFSTVSLTELEKMMPLDPKWMHGARSCSAIAQAICEKYRIETIVPSDANLIDGVMRQEFRNIALGGNFKLHSEDILRIKLLCENQGIQITTPCFSIVKNAENDEFDNEEHLISLQQERQQLNALVKSDAFIVCNPNGQVSSSTLFEIGFAQSFGKRIIFTEKPQDHILQVLPAEIGIPFRKI